MRIGTRWLSYDIHGKLRIKSNVVVVNQYFLSSEAREVPDLVIYVGDFDHDRIQELFDEKLSVVYRRGGVLRSKVLLAGLTGRTILLASTPSYRLLRKPGKRLRALIKAVIQIKLIQRGLTYVHSACVCRDSSAAMIVAPPETGKTLTALMLTRSGYKFLSDDMSLVGLGRVVYSNPSPLTIHPIHVETCGLKLGLAKRVEMSLRHKLRSIPYVLLTVDEFRMSAFEVVGERDIAERARVDAIFFLEEGKEYVGELDPEEALKRLKAVGKMHRYLFENEFLQTYAYYNPALDIDSLAAREGKIYEELVEGTRLFVVRSEKRKFWRLVDSVFRRS